MPTMRVRLFVLPFGLLAVGFLPSPNPASAQVAPSASAARPLPTPLTLADAVAIALRRQPTEFIARTQITSANGQKARARAQYFPTLTPTFQYQDTRNTYYGLNVGGVTTNTTTSPTGIPTQTFTNTTRSLDGVTVTRGSGSTLTFNQTLFDSGTRESVNAQARRSLDAAHFGQTDTRQQIILNVTQSFYDLLRADDLVKVSQAQVTRAQQTVAQTQGQIDAGIAARADILQSQADLANAQVSLLQNESAVRATEAALKNAMAIETSGPLQLATLAAEDALPPVPNAGPEQTLDQYVQQAYAARPDLRQQRSTIEVSKQSVKQAKINAGLALSGSYVLTYQPTNDIGTKGTNSQVVVTASYPLFDAGGARGGVHIAEASRDADLDRLEQLRQSVRLAVEQSYYNRALALQRTTLAQIAIQAAQASFDAATARRQAGVGTVLDITTAQVSLTQAQNQYVTAIYDFYTADAQLRRAIGQNDVGVNGVGVGGTP
jgi:outer membrane protein